MSAFNKYKIGIDPGLTGAICILEDNIIIDIIDMPVIENGKGAKVKNIVDPKKLYELLTPYATKLTTANLEFVASRPSNSPTSCFSLGDSYGCIRAVLDCLDIEIKYITPKLWKAHYRIVPESTKDESIKIATSLYDDNVKNKYFKYKKYHNRAEALLIALYTECRSN